MPARHCGVARSIVPWLHEWNSATGCGRCRRGARCEPFSRCWPANESCRRLQIPSLVVNPAVRRRWSFRIRRGPSAERSRQRLWQLNLPEEFAEQHVEMMHAVFALDGVAPAVVGRRTQTALNVFAEANIFVLHFLAERDRAPNAFLIFLRVHFVEKRSEEHTSEL